MTLPTEGSTGHLQKHADIDTLIAGHTDQIAAGDVTNPASAAAIALSATYAGKTRVVIGPTGDFTNLADALAAYPTGNIDIYISAAMLSVPAPLVVAGVKNVSITGRSAFGPTKLNCTTGFTTATASSDAWTIRNLQIAHVAGANTDDGINVDYPRRWSVNGCYFSGFGGASVRLRGGLHCEVTFNYFLAEDSTNTNGLAAIYIEKSAAAVVATTIRTQGNYIGAGVQYGIYVDSAKQSIFDNDIVEGCATGFYFKSVSGELRQPYTEANTVGISILDSPGLLVSGDLRDQPTVTWSGVTVADRRIVQIGARFINPGKGIVFGGSTASTDMNTAPSIRWGTDSPEGVVTGVVSSLFLRTDGGTDTTMYRKEVGTGNTGWVASATGASATMIDAAKGNAADRINTIAREAVVASNAQVAGTAYVTCFTPVRNLTINKLALLSGSVVWAGNTLTRFGLYSLDASNNATLVAQIASDTTIFTTANTFYQKTLDTAAGYPASYTLVSGQRYAVAVLGVGGTVGAVRGIAPPAGLAGRGAVLGGTIGTGLTDLPVGPVAVTAGGLIPWAELIV